MPNPILKTIIQEIKSALIDSLILCDIAVSCRSCRTKSILLIMQKIIFSVAVDNFLIYYKFKQLAHVQGTDQSVLGYSGLISGIFKYRAD